MGDGAASTFIAAMLLRARVSPRQSELWWRSVATRISSMSASPKTTRTDASVQDFLASVKSDAQRADAQVLVDLLDRLGRHEVGKACLYVRKLANVDAAVLRELVDASFA